MLQGSIWYDTCPVCNGCCTVPCRWCSGSGHCPDTGEEQAAAQTRRRPSVVPTGSLALGQGRRTCCDCGGVGVVSCVACHGHGLYGRPAYAGLTY